MFAKKKCQKDDSLFFFLKLAEMGFHSHQTPEELVNGCNENDCIKIFAMEKLLYEIQ